MCSFILKHTMEMEPFVITFFLDKQVNVMIHCTITGEGLLKS